MDTNKPYEVYIIKSECGKLYTGMSENADIRLKNHNAGISKWTSKYQNWRMVYKESFPNYSEARKREIYLKKQKGGNGLKKIIEGGSSSGP
ncbi:GIY-YIG nuclease family protein [Candidatus Falkowbacteria bacterium]|jgi:putative endonuclease|nr:GIY-YIG nuclease family protein [Candidatus Falkowbacteria bacterium]MBT4433102.1 GIY-YIG nuclease family protein [Candidatus Falkowbacteria bacterium]